MAEAHTRRDWPAIEAALHTASLAEVAARHGTTPGALAAGWRAVHTAIDAGGEAAFADDDELPPEPGEAQDEGAPRIAWRVGHGPPSDRRYAVVVASSASEALAAAEKAGVTPSSVARLGEVRDA